MAIPLAIMAAVSAIASAAGSMKEAQEASAVGNYNASVEQQRGIEAQNQASAQAQMDAQSTTRKMGQVAAAYGAGGVNPQGTPLQVMSDLAVQGSLTQALDKYRGQTQALSDQQQGALDQAQGQAQASAADLKAGTTLLTGATNFAGSAGGQSLLGVGK